MQNENTKGPEKIESILKQRDLKRIKKDGRTKRGLNDNRGAIGIGDH